MSYTMTATTQSTSSSSSSSSATMAVHPSPLTSRKPPRVPSGTTTRGSLRHLKASCRRLFHSPDKATDKGTGNNMNNNLVLLCHEQEHEEATISLDGNSTDDLPATGNVERVQDVERFLCEINDYVADLQVDKEPLPAQIESCRRMAMARYGPKSPTAAVMVSLRRMHQLKVSLGRTAVLQASLIQRFYDLSEDLEWARKECERKSHDNDDEQVGDYLVSIETDLDSQRREVREWERATQAERPRLPTDQDLLTDFYESLLEDTEGEKLLYSWFHPSSTASVLH